MQPERAIHDLRERNKIPGDLLILVTSVPLQAHFEERLNSASQGGIGIGAGSRDSGTYWGVI